MKVVILAGGFGTRLAEKTDSIPKPMVEIGGIPILQHIMEIYAHFGYDQFCIALGYKGDVIKNYFLNYSVFANDIFIDFTSGERRTLQKREQNWKVALMNTGLKTQTGGRVKRLQEWIGNETFMMTYGDGVCNVDIGDLVDFHKSHGKIATVTAVRPSSRFGGLTLEGDAISLFSEKPLAGEGWINGGFFVLNPEVFSFIPGDDTPFERYPLETLAKKKELMAYRHEGFWHPMDTLRDMQLLQELCDKGTPPWKHSQPAVTYL